MTSDLLVDTSRAPRVLYLVHDLDDPAVWRRTEMLRLGGASVTLAGFRRGDGPLPEDALVLGHTRNGRMAERALSVLHQRLRPNPRLRKMGPFDAIMARNLEMLALAVPLARQSGAPLTYEVLDIHRLMVGASPASRLLRRIERRLCRHVSRLVVSSPAFLRNYFEPYGQCGAAAVLVENKVLSGHDLPKPVFPPAGDGRLRIGWFGILRCRTSLHCLDAITRERPGRFEVVLRGKPALDAMPDFHDVVSANPDLRFEGPYAYPDDLPQIYGEVDLAWLVDRYDEGANSDWLLPNRLYESGMAHVPPIALEGTEIARRMASLGIGIRLQRADAAAALDALDTLGQEGLAELREAQAALPEDTWRASPDDGRQLLSQMLALPKTEPKTELPDGGVLIVVPTLNEETHVGAVIDGLAPSLRRLAADGRVVRLVIADGGSTDATRQVVRERIEVHPDLDLRLMDNPDRLQSAAVNQAARDHGKGMTWLLRMDAHARYPDDYVETLLSEAGRSGAASIVVAMRAISETPTQRIIARTQNSPLGNGGAAHRTGNAGRFVDHGHHALMRMEAFLSVGGYDATFSHNEDAELDLRLAQAGHRIWLTQRTRLDYVPRKDIASLARQYLRFGAGRARTVLKHRAKPRLRQMIPIAIAPSVALLALAPVHWIFALPALAWLSACLIAGGLLAVGQRDLSVILCGPVAAVMQLAWSVGFWNGLAAGAPHPAPLPAPEASVELPDRIAVGVCTFRRPGLIDTLASLEKQQMPSGTRLSIIVADNDDDPTAFELVERFASGSGHDVIYRHAPAGNISVARNAVLEAARSGGFATLAFIDDDEIAPPNWLQGLATRLAHDDADVVVGPVRAIYPNDAPDWMLKARPHDTVPELGSDGRPIAGHSCNVAMDLSHPALQERHFDHGRGLSGGEDTAFFHGAVEQGARLALAPEALLEESVPSHRARLGWLLKRKFRMGQTHGTLLRSGPARSLPGRLRQFALAGAKAGYCGGAMVLSVPFAPKRNAALLRGALHVGTLAGLTSARTVTIYGGAPHDTKRPRAA
ncbi:glycosyltransferase [Aestuariibius sp. 2305UL40-4]|uniref:glycosyltransferase n=1 Tax=Aestuariibius violaceus TaxID=3234132 RepID=UPI00345E4CF0